MPGIAARADAAAVGPRRAAFYRWGPYGLLAMGTVASVVSAGVVGMTTGEEYVAAVLVLASLALQLVWGSAARSRPGPSTVGTVYYSVRWALGFVLSWLNPFFAFYAVTGYYDAGRLLRPRLMKVGFFATAITMSGSQVGGMPPHGRVLWLGFGLVLGVNVGLLAVFSRLAAQDDEHARVQVATIAELERTNAALQQALDENAALHAQLLVQAREAGVADERRRLAAEIHDTLAQGLTGIIAQLQVVANVSDLAVARIHLDRAADLARHSLGEARRSVHNLAPVALENDGLPEALKKTVTEWGERTGVRAEFTLTGTAEQLHEELAATLLRIVQEALSNAARHARATRVGVTLTFLGDEVILDIRDDGTGFDLLALPARSFPHSRLLPHSRLRSSGGTPMSGGTPIGGFGLDGMRARAERIGGALTVESEPGQGTAVSARVPLVRHDR
ncbi:sensor histidine kinase [Streptomyces sp. NPDC002088]|uniref:sensor histidine kinase n=1 Tax=Streptomyces sp. NPDC002088 TaxID=3154665 RepID=UPI00332E6F3F